MHYCQPPRFKNLSTPLNNVLGFKLIYQTPDRSLSAQMAGMFIVLGMYSFDGTLCCGLAW